MKLDCSTCGACCTAGDQLYTIITSRDRLRLPQSYEKHITYRKGIGIALLAEKRTQDGVVCVALAGRVGSEVSCAIYSERPSCCRTFEVGGKDCLERRKQRRI